MQKKIIIFIIWIFIPWSLYTAIEVYPTRIERQGLPGQVSTNYYVIKNNNPDPIDVTVNYKDWFRLRENRMVTAADYLVIQPLSFIVNPGEKKAITCIARIPEKAVGELVSMIYFNYREASDLQINTKFGVSLYLAVQGTIISQGKINNIEIQKYQKNNKTNYLFSVEVQNTGNVHLRPSGSIKINNQYDEYIGTVELTYGWPVYPGQKYKYTGSFTPENDLRGQFNAVLYMDKLSEGIVNKQFKFEINEHGIIAVKNL